MGDDTITKKSQAEKGQTGKSQAKESQDSQPASASDIATDFEGAPKFLSAPIIRYLREISDAEAWQALITEYFAFEKGNYPAGVLKSRLSYFFRLLTESVPEIWHRSTS